MTRLSSNSSAGVTVSIISLTDAYLPQVHGLTAAVTGGRWAGAIEHQDELG